MDRATARRAGASGDKDDHATLAPRGDVFVRERRLSKRITRDFRHPEDPAAQGQSLEDYMEVALNMMANTATFDASGHPAMSIPCGAVGSLPVGMMLVGRRFDEATVLRAAFAFEQAGFASLA